MHAHTSAQLAATAFPPVVSASPHATSAARIPTPPDSSKSPIRVSDNKTIVVEAPPSGGNSDGSNSDSDSDSSDSAGIDSAAKSCSPVEFDAKNLHIPVQKSRSPEEVKVGGVGVEGQGRRKSEGAAAALMRKLGMGWAAKWEGGVGQGEEGEYRVACADEVEV
ncbi:hypothetical protein NpNSSI1_00011625 [Neofusicoccum parvum]|uniref:Uncharacterized protein n=1 Tax=Neofusicoccum parvum TaxID=310453 RepID=A0ACB5RSR5_9PEZI|nr:hypothetical protein NpPPO83_00006335 [Neofusicoccum parvum]GME63420.1 hypothetical protein NpNSSI1_00011625 [Neofusicoccum parvum]